MNLDFVICGKCGAKMDAIISNELGFLVACPQCAHRVLAVYKTKAAKPRRRKDWKDRIVTKGKP